MENPLMVHDLYGEAVEVYRSELRLMQADDYRHYRLSGKRHLALSVRQQTYWQDLYQKLLTLAERQS